MFIKLIEYRTNIDLYINIDHIVMFYRFNNNDYTDLMLSNNKITSHKVIEEPTEIRNKIGK